MVAEWHRRIEARLGRSLEPATLLDNPTLARLGALLDGLLGGLPGDLPAAPAPAATAPSTDGLVAVVGMACRFPGAPDLDTFWDNLAAGRCSVAEVPASRWDHRRHYRPEPELGASVSRWGGFVDGVELFDASHFGLTDEEATRLDPAIRLVLESAATCLSDAGYGSRELWGRDVGVFVGGRLTSYGRRAGVWPGLLRSDQNFIAAHVAHHLNLRGPSLVVDSACSSSLVSVQLA